jgi:hypothetical protein
MIRQRHCGAVALLCMTGFGFVTDSRADDAIEVEEGVGSNEVNFDDSGLVASEAEAEGLLLVRLEGSLALGYEKFVHSGDPDARVSDVFTTIESEIAINLSPHAGLGAVLVYEPVIEPGPGEDRFFGDHGLFAEELYAGVDIGKATLQIGKIAPMFGWAADDAPGLYGGDLPGEYELVEEIGINARISLSEAPASSEGTTVEHALHAAVFTADTTFLSDSLFTSRGRLEISDGGVGNTGFPQSFAIAYTVQTRDADDELAGPSLQAAMRRLAPGEGDTHGEWGFLGAFEDQLSLGRGVALSPIAEAAYLIQADGEAEPGWAVLIGAELAKGPWRGSSTFGARDTQADGHEHDYAITADVGRIFDIPGLGEIRADIAYTFARDDEERSHVIGVQLEREFTFGLFR